MTELGKKKVRIMSKSTTITWNLRKSKLHLLKLKFKWKMTSRIMEWRWRRWRRWRR